MSRRVFIFWSLFATVALGRLVGSFYGSVPDATSCLKHFAVGEGVVDADPERKETGQVLVVRLTRLQTLDASSTALWSKADQVQRWEIFRSVSQQPSCVRNILIRIKTDFYPSWAYGDRILIAGTLARPFNFASDGGRSFDYRGYLAKDDIFYEMKSADVSLSGKESLDLTALLFKLKKSFVTHLERSLGEPQAALAAGLVVGEKSAMGADLLADFRTVGLIHIVVLSGFNITIVGVALRRIFSFLPRAWGIVLGGTAIMLFGILVGGGATVVRSCFMAGVALIADLIRRDYQVGRALAFAALIMLIENPLILLHDPSFQLSFLATLGLLLLASPIEERLGFIPEVMGMRGTVATCLATQIFVSPFILYLMGQLSLIGVLVNILVLPFIPVTMLLVFVTGALGFISGSLALLAGWGAHILLAYELGLVQYFARVPLAALTIPAFSIWWVAAFYAVFFTAYFTVSYRQRLRRQLAQNAPQSPTS